MSTNSNTHIFMSTPQNELLPEQRGVAPQSGTEGKLSKLKSAVETGKVNPAVSPKELVSMATTKVDEEEFTLDLTKGQLQNLREVMARSQKQSKQSAM